MGRLPKDLEEKRLRLERAARRGAFESYVRHGRVPEAYERIAALVNEAKRLGDTVLRGPVGVAGLPVGRPTGHYTWRTAGDDRVRGTHAARNGQVFSWANPPEHGHPASEPNCRCWPDPYYGDPAVPDALLAMVRKRQVNTDPGVLWASIDTLSRPDGSLAASAVVMADGTVIDSSFVGPTADHSVTLPDGAVVRAQRDAGAYKLSVDSPGEKPVLVAQLGRLLFPPAPLPPAPAPHAPERAPIMPLDLPTNPWFGAFNAARAIFNMLQQEPASLGAGPSDVPVLVYRVWQIEAGSVPVLVTEVLSKEQVTQWCPHAAEVQSFIDLAAEEWAPLASTMNPAVLGTNIHMTAKQGLDAAKLANPARYANLYPEVSLDLEPPRDLNTIGVPYGTAGSTRLDVMELVNAEMGCVYDYKTGQAGLTTARVLKILAAWDKRFPDVPVVIIEMRQHLPVWSE